MPFIFMESATLHYKAPYSSSYVIAGFPHLKAARCCTVIGMGAKHMPGRRCLGCTSRASLKVKKRKGKVRALVLAPQAPDYSNVVHGECMFVHFNKPFATVKYPTYRMVTAHRDAILVVRNYARFRSAYSWPMRLTRAHVSTEALLSGVHWWMPQTDKVRRLSAHTCESQCFSFFRTRAAS